MVSEGGELKMLLRALAEERLKHAKVVLQALLFLLRYDKVLLWTSTMGYDDSFIDKEIMFHRWWWWLSIIARIAQP